MSVKNFPFYLLILITASMLILSIGCAERNRKESSSTGSNTDADAALAKAEKAMEEAPLDIGISFEQLQGLESHSDLTTILPNPIELGQMENPIELGQMEDSLEGSTAAMYEVLKYLGYGVTPSAAPMQAPQIGSDMDLAMVHLHIAYLYIYDVIFRLVKVRKDPPLTGVVIYEITFPDDPTTDNIEEIYQIELTDEGQRRLDEAQLNDDPSSAFTEEQRQEIINALYLLFDAQVTTIKGNIQKNNIDTLADALYHFKEMLVFAKKLAPDIEEGLEDLSKMLSGEENFARKMLDRAEEEWGFVILNREDVIDSIDELDELVEQ